MTYIILYTCIYKLFGDRKNIEYYSLDCIGEQYLIHNLDTFPIPLKDKSFDIILCLETLEHTLYPHRVMKELIRIAKPDALFLLSMPNEYNIYCRINFLLGKKTDVQEPFQVIEKHLHIQLPRVKDIIRLFSSYLQIEEINYPWYSRNSYHNSHFKRKFFVFIDKLINKFFAKVYPPFFTRAVVIKEKMRK